MLLNIRTRLLVAFLLILPFLLLPLLARAEDDDFVIYHAQTRPAPELADMAKQMVAGIRTSNMNDKIVIYGTKKQREAALKLMKELDLPARMYRVRVRAVSKAEAAREAAAIEGVVGTQDAKAGKKGSGVLRGGGATVGVGGKLGGVQATVESETRSDAGEGQQQVTVMEGGTAEISAGTNLFPTGAQVTVRAQGRDGVNVKLKQQASKGIQKQQVGTEVSMKLGVWRTVGSVSQSNEGTQAELLGKGVSSSSSSQVIQLMVELDTSGDL